MVSKTARQQLAKTINDKLGKRLTLREAEQFTSEIVDAMVAVTIENGELRLNEYGKLKVTTRPARSARNPKTGATIDVRARKTLAFKPSPKFIKQLNQA